MNEWSTPRTGRPRRLELLDDVPLTLSAMDDHGESGPVRQVQVPLEPVPLEVEGRAVAIAVEPGLAHSDDARLSDQMLHDGPVARPRLRRLVGMDAHGREDARLMGRQRAKPGAVGGRRPDPDHLGNPRPARPHQKPAQVGLQRGLRQVRVRVHKHQFIHSGTHASTGPVGPLSGVGAAK